MKKLRDRDLTQVRIKLIAISGHCTLRLSPKARQIFLRIHFTVYLCQKREMLKEAGFLTVENRPSAEVL